jgi:DNA-directed RNA polymerase sigma subunit (sigma70/sigma32)
MSFINDFYPSGFLLDSSLDAEDKIRALISKSSLTDKEKRILIGTYCADLYDVELSNHLRLDRHRVKKMRDEALRKLGEEWNSLKE